MLMLILLRKIFYIINVSPWLFAASVRGLTTDFYSYVAVRNKVLFVTVNIIQDLSKTKYN